MSYNSIKLKSDQIRNEQMVGGNKKERVANVIDDLNETKADSETLSDYVRDLQEADSELSRRIDSVSVSGLKGEAFTNTVPTEYNPIQYPDGLFEKYDVLSSGTFVNFKKDNGDPVEVTVEDLEGNYVQIWVTNGISKKVLIDRSGIIVNGKVAKDDINAVSGGTVYDRFTSVINLGSVSIPFVLANGGLNVSTGVPNTSVNWIRTTPVTCASGAKYTITGYGMDSNSVARRVFFYQDGVFISYIESGSATVFTFTTPPNCNNFMIQVASGTDVGASPTTSPYNQTLLIGAGDTTPSGDSVRAETISGVIQTDQIKGLEVVKTVESDIFTSKFTFTDKVATLGYKNISLTQSSGVTHQNFAVSKMKDVSIIESTVVSIASNGSLRLGFGDQNACFQLVKTATSSSSFDVFVMSRYGVTSVGTLSIGTSVILKAGDTVRLYRSGLNIIAYINNVLSGNLNLRSQGGLNSVFKGVIGFRDNVQVWTAGGVEMRSRYSPYMHISVDDSINVFRELASTNPVSIFDNARLAVYRDMHDKYGACFSLFAFYQNSNASFNLTQMPDTWKAEFIQNSHWLKIGFHGVDSTTDYTAISVPEGVGHYTRIINEVNRFAGLSTIDNMPRFSMFKGNKPLYLELKKYGLLGTVTSDDARIDDSGLTAREQNAINAGDDYFSYEMGMYFVRTSPRLDLVTATGVVSLLKTESNNPNTSSIYEMFYHEGRESSQEGKDMIDAMCKFAHDRGVRFDFPQNNIFN